MGNLVADAMLDKYAGEAEAAYTNSGGLRADLPCSPPSAGRRRLRDHARRAVRGPAVRQRDRRRDADRRPDEDRVHRTGSRPSCDYTPVSTGRFPQIAGLRVEFHCNGTGCVVIDGIWKTPDGPARRRRSADADTRPLRDQRLHVHRRRRLHVFTQGTNVELKGDLLLDVVADYVEANSPVDPVVEGRIIGT